MIAVLTNVHLCNRQAIQKLDEGPQGVGWNFFVPFRYGQGKGLR